MKKLSVCIIAKNEGFILEKSLLSIKNIADEIIFVDTGSTDDTVVIAKKYTDKVFKFDWVDDFSLAYQFAQDKATNEYVMRWDCDFVLRAGQEKIVELKSKDFYNSNLINFKWNLDFLNGNVTRSTLHHFIWKKSDYVWQLPVHAEIIPKDEVEVKKYSDLSIEVDHLKNPTVKDWRYSKTKKILEELIKVRTNDFRLWVFFTQGFFFEKDFDQTIHWGLKAIQKYEGKRNGMYAILVEQVVFSLLQVKNYELARDVLKNALKVIGLHPRLVLAEADLVANFSVKDSLKLYLEFIKMEKNEDFYIYDYSPERFEVYPNLAIGKIYFYLKDFENASNYFNKVFELTNDNSLKQKIVWQKRISKFFSIF